MPIIDALDFLLDERPALGRSVIYLHYGSGGLRSRVISKIKRLINDSGVVVSGTTMPLSGSLMSLVEDVCDYLDLSLLPKTHENWKDINTVFEKIAYGNLPSSGLILTLPVVRWSLKQGPIWFDRWWTNWRAAEASADVILEPIVSECSSESIVSKLMILSDLFQFDRMKNKDLFFDEMQQFAKSGSVDLWDFCDRFDYITLLGVDYETGWFDRDAVAIRKPNPMSRTTIGSALMNFVLDPTAFTLKNAVRVLGERLNRRSVSARSVIRQIVSVSLTLLKGQKPSDVRVDYWAWLVLSRDIEPTAAALMFEFLDRAHRYQDFWRGQPSGEPLAVRLDSIVRAAASTNQRPTSSLERARVDLVAELATRMHDRQGADQPSWMGRLQVALQFASAGSHFGEDEKPPPGTVEQEEESAKGGLPHENARSTSSSSLDVVRPHDPGEGDDNTDYDYIEEEGGFEDEGETEHETLPEALGLPSPEWVEGDHLQSFSDIIGQESARTALRLRIQVGEAFSHYVFQGPAGVGKRAIARIFARGINCKSPLSDGSACETCESCVRSRSAGEIFIDWHRVRMSLEQESINEVSSGKKEAALRAGAVSRITKSKELKKVHDIEKYVECGSLFHRVPVLIFDSAEMLDEDASDALLQILEKRPDGALCMFLTTDISRLRPALKSRAQAYRLGPITREQTLERIRTIAERESVQIEDRASGMLAAYAEDRAGAILQALWTASRTGEVTVSQAREVLDLKWVERLLPFWAAVGSANEEGVLAGLAGLHKVPAEALRRLQLSMYILILSKILLASENEHLLPAAFMITGRTHIKKVLGLLEEIAKNLNMLADDVVLVIGQRLSLIEDSENASIIAEILHLAKDLRTEKAAYETTTD